MGFDCNILDCFGGCVGNGYCEGYNRDVFICFCKDVSIVLFYLGYIVMYNISC